MYPTNATAGTSEKRPPDLDCLLGAVLCDNDWRQINVTLIVTGGRTDHEDVMIVVFRNVILHLVFNCISAFAHKLITDT